MLKDKVYEQSAYSKYRRKYSMNHFQHFPRHTSSSNFKCIIGTWSMPASTGLSLLKLLLI